jgi:hypothetical protein
MLLALMSIKPRTWLSCLLGLGSLLGCGSGYSPTDFRLEVTPVLLSTDPARVLIRSLDADRKPPRADQTFDFEVQPQTVARVDPLGTLVCLRNGDGTVRLRLGANTRSAPFKCRLVDRVDASNVGRVELTAGPFKPKIRVLGKNGEELSDVELLLSSKNAGILFPRGGDLVPKEVGTATVIARAGLASREFTVDVVRKVTPEALPLDQNRKVFYSLEMGKYELRVVLPSPMRLVAEWREAPYCNYVGTSAEHVSVCVLRHKGGVVFDSPSYLTHHSTDVDVQDVTIFEVP